MQTIINALHTLDSLTDDGMFHVHNYQHNDPHNDPLVLSVQVTSVNNPITQIHVNLNNIQWIHTVGITSDPDSANTAFQIWHELDEDAPESSQFLCQIIALMCECIVDNYLRLSEINTPNLPTDRTMSMCARYPNGTFWIRGIAPAADETSIANTVLNGTSNMSQHHYLVRECTALARDIYIEQAGQPPECYVVPFYVKAAAA